MNYKKITTMGVILITVCFLGYRTARNLHHEKHEHNDSELDTKVASHEEEGQVIELTADEIQEIGLETTPAGPGIINNSIMLTGEISINGGGGGGGGGGNTNNNNPYRTESSEDEWVQISSDQHYIPGREDIGRKLKVEAAAYSIESGELLMHRVVKTDLVLSSNGILSPFLVIM